jgi:DNA repair photolyase
VKGRGATYNPKNRFLTDDVEKDDDYLEFARFEDEDLKVKTEYIEVFPKTIINKVPSPDVPMDYSVNPYQGCEHGCIYCYARPTHEYWGYSAGLDFESKILVKTDAVKLFRKELSSRSYVPKPIMFSGNTDCYQPAEKKFQLTRKMLEVMEDFNNPVGIITKNSLILRDLDILARMAEKNQAAVTISLTSLDENTRRVLEPRTSSSYNRLKAIETLAKHNIPVSVNIAPIVPAVNDFEIPKLIASAANAGAYNANYIIVRLNHILGDLFTEWAHHHFPDRAEKILSLVSDIHQGNLGDTQFKKRMRGSGAVSEQIRDLFKINAKRHFPDPPSVRLDSSKFKRIRNGQLGLF